MSASPTPIRRRVERWSYRYLVILHRLPRWLLVGALLVLLLGGFFAPRWIATACLAVIVAFLGWLSYLAWSEGGRGRHLVRLLALALAVGATALRAAGM